MMYFIKMHFYVRNKSRIEMQRIIYLLCIPNVDIKIRHVNDTYLRMHKANNDRIVLVYCLHYY